MKPFRLFGKAAGFFAIALIFALPVTHSSIEKPQATIDQPIWQEIAPQAGNIRVIAPATPTTIYLGTYDGVFRGDGNTWVRASAGLENLWITSLVVDPNNPSILYASTGESPGMYKSTDGGSHWGNSSAGLTGEVRTLAINSQNSSVIYAQTATQIYKSTDAGLSWQLKSQGISTGENEGDLLSLTIAPSNPAILYVSEVTGHLYRSVDGGETWVLTSALLGERAWSLAVDPSHADWVYAGTFADGMYRSSDGGQTWEKRNQGMPNSGLGQMIQAILINRIHPDTLYASMNGNGMYKTTDAGMHWTRLTSVGQYNSPVSLAADMKAGDTIYAGYDGLGFYSSSNGGKSWKDHNQGLSGVPVRSLAVGPKNASSVYIGGGSAGIFSTHNWGLSWKPINSGLEFADFPAIAVDPKDNHNIYLGADGGGFYRSSDGGRSWKNVPIGPDVIEIYALAVDPLTPKTIYAGAFDYGLFKSTDYGKTWNPTALQGTSAIAIAIDPRHPSTLYAGADGVWKSVDGGATFDRANDGLGEVCVNRLVVNPDTPSTLYAVSCDNGLYHSTDSAAHWSSIKIPDAMTSWVSAFALDPQQPATLYAATGEHLYRSTDAGTTCELFEAGLPIPWQIDHLEVSPLAKGCVYAAGFYNPGLYSTCAPASAQSR